MEATFEFNGQKLTMAELNAKMAELANLQKLQKEAKKAGVLAKPTKVEKERPAEIALLVEAFKPVITANIDLIAPLFSKGIEGQDSVSMAVNADYQVIIRSTKVTKAKQQARIEAAKAAAEAEKTAEVA